MKDLKDYVNIDSIDSLLDFIQEDNTIITYTNKIILDDECEDENVSKNTFYKKGFIYDYEYEDDMDTSDLKDKILDDISDETGWLIDDSNIMIKKKVKKWFSLLIIKQNLKNKLLKLNIMKSFKVLKKTNCKKNFGFGIMDWVLCKGSIYTSKNLKIGKKRISFSIYYNENWVGNIFIDKKEFEEKCVFTN